MREHLALGAADVGVAIETAALAYDLDFVPLAEERFDLAMFADRVEGPTARVLEAIDDRGFRREVGAMDGYDASVTGHACVVEAA